MGISDYRQCHLIIDSNCDLPAEVIKSLDVEVLHFPYIMDGTEYLDDFWQTRDAHEFYEEIRAGKTASTAAYPIARFLETFRAAAQKGRPTVYLSFPAALSGSYNMALMAAETVREEYPEFELYIVDNCSPSIGAAQLVMQAVRLRDRGLSAKELAEWAQEAKNFIHGYFTLDNLEALARGGRIPAAAAQISGKLDIKANLSYDLNGALTMVGIARGRKKALKILADKFKANYDGDKQMPVCIASSDADKDAAFLVDLIRKEKEFSDLNFLHCTIGPVIGSHVGPGMVALAFWGKDRREHSSIADKIAERIKRNG